MKVSKILLSIFLVLLIVLGIYTFGLQNRLRQTEYELTALQDKIVQLAKEIDGLDSEVGKLDSEMYEESKGLYTPRWLGKTSRLDKLEDKLYKQEQASGDYGSLEWEVDNLKRKVDIIKDALEQEGFRLSWFDP